MQTWEFFFRCLKGGRKCMFKLMIADDNPYALGELRDIVDWEQFDLSLIGAFPDGKELLCAAEKNIPDLVITDISMPILNGIALTTALRALSPDIKIVFLTNYSDFEYAQKAVQLHINDYLLKPFDSNQLASVMKRIVQELCAERLQHFEQDRFHKQAEAYRIQALENYIGKLLYQAETDTIVRGKLAELDYHIPHAYILCVAHVSWNEALEKNHKDCRNCIRSILHTYQSDNCLPILLSYNSQGFSILILSTPELDMGNALSQLHIDIETAIGITSTIGFSSTADSFDLLAELNAQAIASAAMKDSTSSAIISYDEVRTDTDTPVRKHTPDTISNYVLQMQNFIHKNYMLPITTNDVSSAVYLSSSYANQCFSSECGCTIFDYITQRRIEQAKKLLSETNTKVSSVAELVGYSGKTSFYLAFKRNVGVSPTEYRSMHNFPDE